ncbi:MAG: DUF5723 family protein [Bacteroidales bacterium]
MKKIILISFFIRLAMPIEAQEMQGLVNSNYAGLSGVIMNPSSMADSKLYLDINLITANVFYQTDKTDNAFANFRLNGPEFMINAGKSAFALIDAARTAISYRETDMSSTVGNGEKYKEMHVAGLAWGEIGLSYAYQFYRAEKSIWSGGLTLKYLSGAGGAYFTNDNTGYTFNSSIPSNLSNSGLSGSGGMGSGHGMGMDIGFTYEKKTRQVSLNTYNKLSQQKFQDYDYKFGISLIDVGFIKFSKNVNGSSFNQSITSSSQTVIDSSKNDLITDTSKNSSGSSLSKNSFSMYLPAAVCIQFDYHYYKNWYFNGTFVKGLNLSDEFVRRPTMLAITPRFEKRRFEASLPLSVSDMKYFRVGLALRFWSFTIGTDNLLGSVGVGSNAGFDLYTSIKITFDKGRFRRKHDGAMANPNKKLFG